MLHFPSSTRLLEPGEFGTRTTLYRRGKVGRQLTVVRGMVDFAGKSVISWLIGQYTLSLKCLQRVFLLLENFSLHENF